MGRSKASTEAKLEALRLAIEGGDQGQSRNALKEALMERSNFVVAKAAEWCGQNMHYSLIPDLVEAYDRFTRRPLDSDKTCAAKRAIVRALYELDYDDVGFYERGLRYVQSEPVWGGHVDTAVDVRCACALGLAASSDPRAMIRLIELMHDEEPQARIGAVRAMEMMQPYQAEIVLRYKILQGDPAGDVIAQCFFSLIKVAPEESLTFVCRFLEDRQQSVREGAALALGESRLDEALDILVDRGENITAVDPYQQIVFKAIALQRKEKAWEYLLSVIGRKDEGTAGNALAALSIYSYNQDLESRVKAVLAERDSDRLNQKFERHWELS